MLVTRLPSEVKIYYQIYRVSLFTDYPRPCLNCWKFNHSTRYCHSQKLAKIAAHRTREFTKLPLSHVPAAKVTTLRTTNPILNMPGKNSYKDLNVNVICLLQKPGDSSDYRNSMRIRRTRPELEQFPFFSF